MKSRVALTVLLAGVVMIFSCKENPTGPTGGASISRVSGTVLRSDNLSVVPNALVYDISGGTIDTTSSNGSFLLSYSISSTFNSRIIASRLGFKSDTASIVLTPGRDTTMTLIIVADSTSPSTGAGAGGPGSIGLVSSPDQIVAVRGTGGIETTAMVFEVRDSLGVPISDTLRVNFSLQGGPNAGEYLNPASALTNPLTGRVTTKITSGTKAGVVQVYASATIGSQLLISRPVRVIFAGGFPVNNGVSIGVGTLNLPAVIDNITDDILVSVADKDGNPVNNAAVYFGTNGGRIDPGGLTDPNGNISTVLRTGGLTPPGSGIVTVRATTVDSAGNQIVKTAPIIFSGATQILAPGGTFVIPDSGLYSFSYNVLDAAGNPLSAGTHIAVTISGDGSGDLNMIGDKDVTIPDTQSPTYTNFGIVIRDPKVAGASGYVLVKIDVTSKNGNATRFLQGVVLGSGSSVYIPPSQREPAQIEAGAPSRSTVDVAGVGGIETSVLAFTVKDSAGAPFDATKRIYVSFAVEFIPNSYVSGGTQPQILPSADSTDNSGRARVTLASGTQAGVAQVVATVNTVNGPLIARSKQIVVRAGDPNQSHFTLTTDAFSFGGNLITNPTFVVQVADTFSNPAAGRNVYFHTWAGNIQGATTTDPNGRGSVEFLGGDPRPTPAGTASAGRPTFDTREGIFWVVAQTTGKSGSEVKDSVRMCWSVGPVDLTGLPGAPLAVPTGGSSAAVNVNITDGSVVRNPLPVGTKIETSVDWTTDVPGIKFATSGDLTTGFPVVIPNGSYVVDPGPGVTTFSFNVVDISQGGAPVGMSMVVRITITPPLQSGIGAVTYSFNAQIQ